jgi:hypothetical protein
LGYLSAEVAPVIWRAALRDWGFELLDRVSGAEKPAWAMLLRIP